MRPSASWHPKDVISALAKRGHTLTSVGNAHGIPQTQMSYALRKPLRRPERLIAEAIGVSPSEIWPDRYSIAGTPLPRTRN